MRNLPGAAHLVVASSLLLPAAAFAADLRIAFIDVGQGDAEVIIAPSGCAAVIDGGPTGSGADIKAYLHSQGVTQIAFGIASHYHSDHIGGLDEVAQGTDGIPFTKMYDRGGSYSSTVYTEYANQFAGKRSTVTRGQTFSLCNEVTFEVVAVNGNGVSTTDENALSAGVKITYGAFNALFGGDIPGTPTDIESTLLGHVGEVEVYKVHHHCSKYSSIAAFLSEILPTVSVIEVGVGNTYGHPTAECLSRLQAVNSIVYETEDPATSSYRGNVVVTSTTGASYVVTQQGTSAVYTSKGGGGGGGGDTVLTDGVPLGNQSGAAGAQAFYKISVPAGQTTLTVSTSGGTGDADLYVKYGARPTTSTYDCRPYQSGNNETCTFNSPAAGDWYIMLDAYSAYSGVTVLADYVAGGGGGDPYLTNGVAVTNISGASGSQQYWRLAVPSGKSQVVFTMSGGTGDADLYVRSGSRPTTSTYNCRPYLSGNNETCTISNPAAGDWYVMIRGYSAFSGVSLKGQY